MAFTRFRLLEWLRSFGPMPVETRFGGWKKSVRCVEVTSSNHYLRKYICILLAVQTTHTHTHRQLCSHCVGHTVNPRNEMCDSKRFGNKHKLLYNNANVTTMHTIAKIHSARQCTTGSTIRAAAAAAKWNLEYHLRAKYVQLYRIESARANLLHGLDLRDEVKTNRRGNRFECGYDYVTRKLRGYVCEFHRDI